MSRHVGIHTFHTFLHALDSHTENRPCGARVVPDETFVTRGLYFFIIYTYFSQLVNSACVHACRTAGWAGLSF